MQTLDRHGVEYLLVGGAAAIGYGAQRGTRDVNCMLPAATTTTSGGWATR